VHNTIRNRTSLTLAFAVLLAACSSSASPTGSVECREAQNGAITISAEGLEFDTACLAVPAGEAFTITLVNNDTEPHNVAIYTDSSKGTLLFSGEIINGGETVEYEVGALDPGTYYFNCTVHPGMQGSVIAE
jgi:plastocyanin